MTTNASSKIVVNGYLNSYGFCVKKDSLDDKTKKLLLDFSFKSQLNSFNNSNSYSSPDS